MAATLKDQSSTSYKDANECLPPHPYLHSQLEETMNKSNRVPRHRLGGGLHFGPITRMCFCWWEAASAKLLATHTGRLHTSQPHPARQPRSKPSKWSFPGKAMVTKNMDRFLVYGTPSAQRAIGTVFSAGMPAEVHCSTHWFLRRIGTAMRSRICAFGMRTWIV